MRTCICVVALLILFSPVSVNSFAQNKPRAIYGKIISFEESFPLKGVNVSVKGGKPSTVTLSDGKFSMEVDTDDTSIVVRLDGYETKEIKLTIASEYNIFLKRQE